MKKKKKKKPKKKSEVTWKEVENLSDINWRINR